MGKNGRWLESAVTYVYLGLAALMLVLGVLSLIAGSWKWLPGITICGTIYNLMEAVQVYLRGGKHSLLQAVGLLLLAVLCCGFTWLAILMR